MSHHLRVPGGWLARTLGIALAGFFMLGVLSPLHAEPPLPPKPRSYFNDYAKVVPADAGQRINAKLEAFERATSNQIVVAVFPKLPDGTYLEDYCVKTAQFWGVGGKKKDNGIVLFVFIADRKLRIEVGYGLEGVVPDSIAASIINDVIKPRFKQGDYAGGLDQGVDAIFKATKNEYKGTGRTVADADHEGPIALVVPLIFFVLFVGFFIWVRSRVAGAGYSRGSRYGGGYFSSGGGSSGSFGGGGGFSGGGGSFGGGGSSGGW